MANSTWKSAIRLEQLTSTGDLAGRPGSRLVAALIRRELKRTQSGLRPAIRSQLESALRTRDYARAEILLADEIGRDPKRADLLKLLGHVFFLDGRYLNSAVAMKKADTLGGLDEAGRFLLAMSYIRLGQRQWSRPELLKLEQTHPDKALYPYWTGRLEYLDQCFRAAVVRFRQALKLDPRFVRAWNNLGLAYEALGQQQEAVHSYEEANRLNRESPAAPSFWPPLNLGSLMLKLDRLSGEIGAGPFEKPGLPPLR